MLTLQVPEEFLSCKALSPLMREGAALLGEIRRGEERYSHDLGWLHVEEWAGEESLGRIEDLAQSIRSQSDAFVLIGVGGSNNAARSVIEALREPGNPEVLYAGNTLSPHALGKVLKSLQGKRPYLDCIAKNFSTLEPGASFRILRQLLARQYGKSEAAKRILCTGTPQSRLEEICREEGFAFLPFPENIGGRYTALTNVGLLPMAVAGVDIRALAAGAREMEKRLWETDGKENPALLYAALRSLFFRQGYRLELLSSFEPQFQWFYKWWEQLFAESEGKDGTGLFPVTGQFSEELHSLGQFIQDGSPILFETFLEVLEQQESLVVEPDGIDDGFAYLDHKDFWDVNRASFTATRRAHSERFPCLTLQLGRLDAYHFGELFYFFEFACYLSCGFLGVNPFDQPGVEAYKGWMFRELGAPGAS